MWYTNIVCFNLVFKFFFRKQSNYRTIYCSAYLKPWYVSTFQCYHQGYSSINTI
jgi:hypothetical protein